MKLFESFSDLAWVQALQWGKKKKKKNRESEEGDKGDKGAALSPPGQSIARRFFVLVSYRYFFLFLFLSLPYFQLRSLCLGKLFFFSLSKFKLAIFG